MQDQVLNTSTDDLAIIFEFFESSIQYQLDKGYPVWANYDKGAIIRDIDNKNQYKVMAGEEIAIVFSVSYSDPVIWRELDRGNAIYLHRIVVNPVFKGRRLFDKILNWCIKHAREKGLTYVSNGYLDRECEHHSVLPGLWIPRYRKLYDPRYTSTPGS